MLTINLLPWRKQQKINRKKRLLYIGVGFFLIFIGMWGIVHFVTHLVFIKKSNESPVITTLQKKRLSPLATRHIALTQFKLLGMICINNQKFAVVSLNNHSMKLFVQGEIVSEEHAKLIQISANKLTFIFPDRTQYFLYRKRGDK